MSAEVQLRRLDTGDWLTVRPERLVIAGFTGRDRQGVERHIEELERHGVPRPERVPDFYAVPVELLTTDERITVDGGETSGEAEPVLYVTSHGRFVGAGSDHTARDLEKEGIARSKVACAKVVSREVLPYEALEGGWDDLMLRSWAGDEPYQHAPLSELLPVDEILARLGALQPAGDGDTVVFLGTVPLDTDGFVFSDSFRVELGTPEGPVGLSYSVHQREGAS
jgi:Protein of unknown function (DUF2848)